MNRHQVLLYGGIGGPLAYLLHDIIGVYNTTEFSFIENTVSDLTNSAARANYTLGVWLLIISALMGVCFGLGTTLQSRRHNNRKIFYVGVILAIIGCLNLLAATIFPQDPIGSTFTAAGIIHIVIVGISAIGALVLLWLVAKSVDHDVRSLTFIQTTYGTICLLLLGAIISSVVTWQGWPVLGVVERISVYSFQAWTVFFAIRQIFPAKSE